MSLATAPPATSQQTFRPELQTLRAIAVLCVVGFHLWPERLSGGFVGVDVFFVISGFLITSHIAREVESTGRLALAEFWARRARRLLPASLLVILVSAAGTAILLPRTSWHDAAQELVASALYFQNWLLALGSIDYFAQDQRASVVQHYWSLSVEEQFYIAWPLIIIVCLGLAARRQLDRRQVIVVALAIITCASLWYSVRTTSGDQGFSYFDTFSRAWEFGAGALLALVGRRQTSAGLSALTFWAGLGAIGTAAIAFSGETSFPGINALLPVAGAAAVIVAGMPQHRLTPNWLLASRPGVLIGDLSYSIYLWHWPLIILIGSQVHLFWPHKIMILGATMALAWLSKRYVEDPFRRSPILVQRAPRRTFIAVATISAVTITLPALLWLEVERSAAAARETLLGATTAPCFGAAALGDSRCAGIAHTSPVVPTPELAADDVPATHERDCWVEGYAAGMTRCSFNESATGARVALVGDSHADTLFGPLHRLAQERGWQLDTFLKASCPFSTVMRTNLPSPKYATTCATWNEDVRATLLAEKYDYVVTSRVGGSTSQTRPGESSEEAAVRGIHEAWRALDTISTRIVVVRDNPWTTIEQIECVGVSWDGSGCAIPRDKALQSDPHVEAAATYDRDNVRLVDLTDYMCTPEDCPAVVGGVLVYRDSGHITDTFSTSLAPYLGSAIDSLRW